MPTVSLCQACVLKFDHFENIHRLDKKLPVFEGSPNFRQVSSRIRASAVFAPAPFVPAPFLPRPLFPALLVPSTVLYGTTCPSRVNLCFNPPGQSTCKCAKTSEDGVLPVENIQCKLRSFSYTCVGITFWYEYPQRVNIISEVVCLKRHTKGQDYRGLSQDSFFVWYVLTDMSELESTCS